MEKCQFISSPSLITVSSLETLENVFLLSPFCLNMKTKFHSIQIYHVLLEMSGSSFFSRVSQNMQNKNKCVLQLKSIKACFWRIESEIILSQRNWNIPGDLPSLKFITLPQYLPFVSEKYMSCPHNNWLSIMMGQIKSSHLCWVHYWHMIHLCLCICRIEHGLKFRGNHRQNSSDHRAYVFYSVQLTNQCPTLFPPNDHSRWYTCDRPRPFHRWVSQTAGERIASSERRN